MISYEEFIRTIENSKPEDWGFLDEGDFFIFYLKSNLAFTIEVKEERGKRPSIQEWMEKFDGYYSATAGQALIKYYGSVIKLMYFTKLDGWFIPNAPTLSKWEYAVGRIINMDHLDDPDDDFNRQLRIAGKTVE